MSVPRAAGIGRAMNDGFRIHPVLLDRAAQEALLAEVQALLREAPLYTPSMPRSGRPLSIRMSNAGPLGWVTDRAGYRYQPTHPQTGRPWPPIPERVMEIWRRVSGYEAPPEACLINLYHDSGSKLGLHRDQDEENLDAPVVSISLGATAVFRLGGPERRGPTRTLRLASGDVVVLGGASRHFHHGVDRVLPETSTLLPSPQRLNLTLRRVTAP